MSEGNQNNIAKIAKCFEEVREGSFLPYQVKIQDPMINQTIIPQIKDVIERLVLDWQRVPGLILTEDDLKCHLFGKLIALAELAGEIESVDSGVRASAVHSEVSWFDENNRLTLKPDLTIIEPENLSILHPLQRGIPLPRKGFHFNGNAVILELKLIRDKHGVSRNRIQPIQRDIEKVRRLIRKARDLSPETSIYGFVVVFTKHNKFCNQFHQLVDSISPDDNIWILKGFSLE